MSIKPVAEIHDESIRWLPGSKRVLSGAKLYAIPDTHRVVPASALAGVLQLAGYAVQYTDHGSDLRADFGVISDALQAVPK